MNQFAILLFFILVLYPIFSFEFGLSTNLQIVGGKNVTIESAPYQLSLQLKHKHICGASMISNEWALTAAHCTDGVSADDLFIRAGTDTLEQGGELIAVSEVHQHSKYNDFTMDYDLSLLELSDNITIKSAAAVVLLDEKYEIPVKANATISGWGSTKEGGEPSTKLQLAVVPIVSHDLCKKLYDSLLNTITDRMLCAGYVEEGGVDSCKRDAGGPLVIEGKLCGVISWGTGCGRPNYPGVYTNLTSLRGFIRDVTGL